MTGSNEIVITRVFDAPPKVEPSRYGMKDWPSEALITVTFEEQAGTTKFTLRHAVGSAPAEARAGCQAGWNESLDRLAGYLAEEGQR